MTRRRPTSPASKLKRGILISVSIILLVLGIVYCTYAYSRTGTIYPTPEIFDGLPTIRFVDVGQGDCTLVTYKGDSVLVDAGTVSNGRITAEYVRMYAPVIDYFIITHPHEDHMGGAPYIFDAVSVKTLVLQTDTVEDEFYSQTIAKAEKQGTNIIYLPDPAEFSVGDIAITVLDTFGVAYDDLNNKSLMIRVDVGSTSLLVTGDAEEDEENYVLLNNSLSILDTDILKLGHHGSSPSTTSEFLSAISPETCVVSAGRNNAYGHPSSEVVTRIEEYGAKLHRTDKDGTVIIRGSK